MFISKEEIIGIMRNLLSKYHETSVSISEVLREKDKMNNFLRITRMQRDARDGIKLLW